MYCFKLKNPNKRGFEGEPLPERTSILKIEVEMLPDSYGDYYAVVNGGKEYGILFFTFNDDVDKVIEECKGFIEENYEMM